MQIRSPDENERLKETFARTVHDCDVSSRCRGANLCSVRVRHNRRFLSSLSQHLHSADACVHLLSVMLPVMFVHYTKSRFSIGGV